MEGSMLPCKTRTLTNDAANAPKLNSGHTIYSGTMVDVFSCGNDTVNGSSFCCSTAGPCCNNTSFLFHLDSPNGTYATWHNTTSTFAVDASATVPSIDTNWTSGIVMDGGSTPYGPDSPDGPSVPGGLVAGVVVGFLLLILVKTAICCYCVRRRQRQRVKTFPIQTFELRE